jgi:hypothetical protein
VFKDEGGHMGITASPYSSGASGSNGVLGIESYDGTTLTFQGDHTDLCTAMIDGNVLTISGLTSGSVGSFNGAFTRQGGTSPGPGDDTDPANAAKPVITVHPRSASYTKNQMVTDLSVSANVNDGGTLSYQ